MLRLTRTISGPPDAVFRAWTDPEQLAQWFGPGAFSVLRAELDLRPGGAYRIVFQPAEGEPVTLTGEYVEIDPPRRLVFTWSWEGGLDKLAAAFGAAHERGDESCPWPRTS